MNEVGIAEENPNAEVFALMVDESFTDHAGEKKEKKPILTESFHVKLNRKEKHHYRSYKFVALHVTILTKQRRRYTKTMTKLLTRNPVGATL